MEQLQDFFSSDKVFDSLYPKYIQELSGRHWTPIDIAQKAAHFLAPDSSARVLDIGAGVGKFCITAAACTAGTFTGIEQRTNFVRLGNKVIKKLGLSNVEMVLGNFMNLDMTAFNGIYFYNSFHENLVPEDAIDENVAKSRELYILYSAHLTRVLNEMPIGTRLATYYLFINEVPTCYTLISSHFDQLLKLWVKES